MNLTTWHILTGEYPPASGGVSDYTRQVAVKLAEANVVVHVWTRGSSVQPELCDGVSIHRCLGEFEPRNLSELEKQLVDRTSRATLLVQYVPHGFGMRAMNLPLAYWIDRQASKLGVDVRLMFHEVAFPFVRWPLHHNLIAIANRWMLRTILKNPRQVYMSTTAWQPIVNRYARRSLPTVCLSIPSNIPSQSQSNVKTFRNQMIDGDRDAVVVGHFGTFGGVIRSLTLETIHRLLSQSASVRFVLIGRGATKAKEDLLSTIPIGQAGRIFSVDNASQEDVAAWIQASDIMLQPYPDGISTRRTSAMAGLANGVAVVSNHGTLSETLWRDGNAVALAETPSVEQLTKKTLELIESERLRKSFGEVGLATYQEKFSIQHTISVLLKDEGL